VSRVSGAHHRGFAPGLTHQGCSGGESLATCGRFGRLGIWTLYLPHQKMAGVLRLMRFIFLRSKAKLKRKIL